MVHLLCAWGSPFVRLSLSQRTTTNWRGGFECICPATNQTKTQSIMMTPNESEDLSALFELAEYYKLNPQDVRKGLEREFGQERADVLVRLLKDVNELNA